MLASCPVPLSLGPRCPHFKQSPPPFLNRFPYSRASWHADSCWVPSAPHRHVGTTPLPPRTMVLRPIPSGTHSASSLFNLTVSHLDRPVNDVNPMFQHKITLRFCGSRAGIVSHHMFTDAVDALACRHVPPTLRSSPGSPQLLHRFADLDAHRVQTELKLFRTVGSGCICQPGHLVPLVFRSTLFEWQLKYSSSHRVLQINVGARTS